MEHLSIIFKKIVGYKNTSEASRILFWKLILNVDGKRKDYFWNKFNFWGLLFVFDLYFPMILDQWCWVHFTFIKTKARYWKSLKSLGGKYGGKAKSELCNWIIKKYQIEPSNGRFFRGSEHSEEAEDSNRELAVKSWGKKASALYSEWILG